MMTISNSHQNAWVFLLAATLIPWLSFGSPRVWAKSKSLPVVAVFNIQDSTKSLSTTSLDQLTEYLATRLGEGGTFWVVPRATIRKRLLQLKSKSYRQCYNQACQVEIGRELAATQTVSTRILKIGSDCHLTLQVYDLEKAAALKTASIRTGCREGSIQKALDQAVVRIG